MKPETITVEYGGVLWTRYPNSKRRTHRVYYQRHERWKEPPVFLHRRIYEDNFGPIPEGYHIHHKDNNPENNSPDNLEALPARVHNRITIKELLSNPQRREKAYGGRASFEQRQLNSARQKNRKQIEATCSLCGDKFMTRCYAKEKRLCSECKKMWYSDKNGQHFSKKKQLERFGKVLVPYDSWI